MIGLSWDAAAMALTQARLNQFRSAIRRRVLLKVGNAAGKVMLATVKREEKPVVTGLLAKTQGKKVKAYASSNVVFVVVGPKSNVTETNVRKNYKTGQVYTSKTSRRMNPAKYAHLAGPGRHGVFIPRAQAKCREEVRRVTRDALAEAVAKI